MLTNHKLTGHKVGVIEVDTFVKILNNNELRFYDDGDNYVGFEAPALTANQIWVLPTADGSATQVLRTDGAGNLSWASAAIGSGQVELDDTDASDQLIFDWSEASATDYTLDWKVNASNRTIDLSGNLTLAGNFVTQNNALTINAVDAARTLTLTENFTIGGGSAGTLTYSAASKTLTVAGDCTVNDWFDQAVKAASNVSFGTVGCGSVTSSGTGSFAGASVTVGDADTAGTLILSDGSSHTITIDVPSIAGSWTLTLPTTDGDANQYMKTDGSGNLSWVAAPEVVGHNMSTHGDEDTYNISTSGTVAATNTLTIGVDGTGHDVKFYSATASSYWLWDESADAVVHAFVSDANTAETAHTITVTDATVQSANMHRGLVVGYTSSGAKTGTSYVAGINVDMTLSDASSGATAQAYGITSYITESGTPTIGTVVGVESYIEDLGVNAGALLGMDIGINSTNLATGRHSGIRIKNHSAMGRSAVLFEGGWTIGLDFTGTTSGGAASTITTDIMMTSGGLLNANTGLIDNAKGYCYDAETTATPSGAFTVDWTAKHVQRVTITGAALDVTFTDPPGPCKLTLIVVQGDGDDTIDWTNEASILFPGAVDPTLSTGSGDIDVLTFYFDGTSYLGLFNGNFG